MLDKAAVMELLALLEKNDVRSEVDELLEGCFADQSPARLEAFIQHKVLTHQTPVDVLQDLAENVHQHMIALQESLFELRSTMLQSMNEQYHVDLVQLAPADLIEDYYHLELDEALAFVAARYPHLTDGELVTVCHTLHNSVHRAGEITQSIRLVRQMLEYIFDWAEALSISAVQDYWCLAQKQSPHTRIH